MMVAGPPLPRGVVLLPVFEALPPDQAATFWQAAQAQAIAALAA
jgi:hypothetical protein